MHRAIRLALVLTPAAALAACANPTGPEPVECRSGKIPYAACENRDYVNPLGDYVNPLGDYVNPLGAYAVRPAE